MIVSSVLATLALCAPPTAESLIAGFHEADGTPVEVVGATAAAPESAKVSAHVTAAGAITLRRTVGKKKLDLLVMKPAPTEAGERAGELRVDVTRRGDSGPAEQLVCSGIRTQVRFLPALIVTCYPDARFAAGGKMVTRYELVLERTTLDIGEGALHYRAPRVAGRVEAAKLAWQRFMRRVSEQANLPLTAQVAPARGDAWALAPDTTVAVSADVEALTVRVLYSGKTQGTYELVGLADWLSFADREAVALRLVVPGDKKERVCPVHIAEADKKNPFDTSGPAMSVIGPCFVGLTKARFEAARVGLVGLDAPIVGATEDGWIHWVVNDQRLLVVTAPAPGGDAGLWLRGDSAK